MANPGPDPEDLDRFTNDDAFCPECGRKVSDEEQSCRHCHANIAGRTIGKPPKNSRLDKWFALLVALFLIFLYVTIKWRWR